MIFFSRNSCFCLSPIGSSGVSAAADSVENDNSDEFSSESLNSSDNYSAESFVEGDNAEEFYEDDNQFEGECNETDEAQTVRNQITITLSYTLLNQVRQVSRAEGVPPEDFILELIAEGVTRRAFEDASRPQPSHLMTRTGYVASDDNSYQAPRLSHHQNMGNSQNDASGNYRSNNSQNGQRKFPNNPNNRNNYGNNYGNNSNQNNAGRYNRNTPKPQNFDPRARRDHNQK